MSKLKGRVAPLAGLAAVGASMATMAAVSVAHPDAMAAADTGQVCAPLSGNFACLHGFGCACHARQGQPAD